MTTAKNKLNHLSALQYAERFKFFVLPVEDKKPVGSLVPNGFKDASRDPSQIHDWWDKKPEAGVGIAVKQSGLLVLDIDPRNGGDDSFTDLIKEFGELPPCPQVLTGGGGSHFYFSAHPKIGKTISSLLPGIDLKADGYVVAPPSKHLSGKTYAWSVDGDIFDVKPCPAPEWLLDLCLNYYGSGSGTFTNKNNDEWKKRILGGTREGTRNETIASLSGHLLRKNVDAYIARDLIIAWNQMFCRPPLTDQEVIRTVDSIAKKEGERRGISHD